MLIQLNAEALLGNIFTTQRRQAIRLIEKRLVHFVASDCHNFTKRTPNLSEAMEVLKAKCDAHEFKKLLEREKYYLEA